MDACANELEELKINCFPTLKFFPKAIDYKGPRTVESWSTFIDSDGKINPEDDDDEDEEKKEEEKKEDEKAEETKES